MSALPGRWFAVLAVSLASLTPEAAAQAALGEESYVQVVLRAHPAARQALALEAAAAAKSKSARVLPDPVLGFSWADARPLGGASASETGWSVSQSIPWPGTFSAGKRAADQQAAVFRSEGEATRWELEIAARAAFARLLHARAALEIAITAEAEALALRDLTTRRADLGESRELDRIKTEVEWLREQRITGMFTTPANAGANNWKVVAGGDYGVASGGLPGTIDVVWRNGTSGKLVVWHMNQHGTRTFGTFTTPDAPTPPLDWTVVGPR